METTGAVRDVAAEMDRLWDVADRRAVDAIEAMRGEQEAKDALRSAKFANQILARSLDRAAKRTEEQEARIARLCDDNRRLREMLRERGVEVE